MRIAQDASESVDVAEAGVDKATGDTWSARSGYLPVITGQLTYQRTFATEFDDLFGQPTATGVTPPTGGTPTATPPTGTTTDTPTAPTATGTPTGGGSTFELPFGQDNTWRVGLQIDQGIYGGGRASALNKISRAGARAADVALESARASVALDTASAYFDAVLSDRLYEIATGSLAQTEATRAQTQLGQVVGRQPEFELLRAEVAVQNQQVAVIQAKRQRDMAYQRLRQLLDLSAEEPVVLTSPLEDTTVAETAVQVAGASPPDAIRAPVRQLVETAGISDASIGVARASGLPSLGASASIGWVSYPAKVWPLGDGNDWYSSISGTVALSVPLFNGGRVWGELMKAKADAASAHAQLDQTRELADLDARDARAALDAASAQWAATEGAVEQARRAYEIADLRFAEGVSTQIELSDSRLQLERALVNRAQAARDLAVARTRIALLASLPLQSGSSF
ncbi:MAG: TolC family protein [Myxococcota bacterium]